MKKLVMTLLFAAIVAKIGCFLGETGAASVSAHHAKIEAAANAY